MYANPYVNLRTLVKLALSQKVSWPSLKMFLHDLTSTFESSKELNSILLEELQLLHSKTILDQTKVNSSEKGIQTSQDADTGTKNDVVMIRLFPKQETIDEVDSLDQQIQEQNPLDVIDVKLQQPEQSVVEEDLADHFQNDMDVVNENVAEKDSIEESIQIETNDEEAFQLDQNSFNDETITDSTEEAEPNGIGERTHGKEKNLKCEQCNKIFSSKTVLQIHKRIHTGTKPYQCLSCNKSFSQRHTLKYHERIHTGEKPYHCVTCKKTFSHSYNLKLHQRIHTGEKPYECEKCSKKFKSKSNLNQHILRRNEC